MRSIEGFEYQQLCIIGGERQRPAVDDRNRCHFKRLEERDFIGQFGACASRGDYWCGFEPRIGRSIAAVEAVAGGLTGDHIAAGKG